MNPFQYDCGGSIVDEYHVVCAAHCVFGFKEFWNDMKIVAGARRIQDDNEETRQDRQITSIVYHEDYEPEVGMNHVSVINLKDPLDLTKDGVKAIAMTE